MLCLLYLYQHSTTIFWVQKHHWFAMSTNLLQNKKENIILSSQKNIYNYIPFRVEVFFTNKTKNIFHWVKGTEKMHWGTKERRNGQ